MKENGEKENVKEKIDLNSGSSKVKEEMSAKKEITQNGIENAIIERMKDQDIYTQNHNESNKSDGSPSIWNRDIFDL